MPTFATLTGPGTGVVTDDAAAVIVSTLIPVLQANYAAIIAQIGNAEMPGTLLADLAEINYNIGRIADSERAIQNSLAELNVNMMVMAAAAADNSANQAMLIANQIKTNNFQVQVTKDALKRADLPEPVLPELKEQLKTAVEDGINLGIAAKINGAVTSTINNISAYTLTMIQATETYKTAAAFSGKITEYIKSFLPPSVQKSISDKRAGRLAP